MRSIAEKIKQDTGFKYSAHGVAVQQSMSANTGIASVLWRFECSRPSEKYLLHTVLRYGYKF